MDFKPFQSTLSSRRATIHPNSVTDDNYISIHALLTESDGKAGQQPAAWPEFQSTLSSRRATCGGKVPVIWDGFQSTLSSRRATNVASLETGEVSISIHALLTESDRMPIHAMERNFHISIHALLTESDHIKTCWRWVRTNFNPRSPHGERQPQMGHEERDKHISIHALLTESDATSSEGTSLWTNFNPRSPHGERQRTFDRMPDFVEFQSTLSSRRATCNHRRSYLRPQ